MIVVAIGFGIQGFTYVGTALEIPWGANGMTSNRCKTGRKARYHGRAQRRRGIQRNFETDPLKSCATDGLPAEHKKKTRKKPRRLLRGVCGPALLGCPPPRPTAFWILFFQPHKNWPVEDHDHFRVKKKTAGSRQ